MSIKGIAISMGLGAAAGVTFGSTLASESLSEKVTFPFRALKSDMIVFLAIVVNVYIVLSVTKYTFHSRVSARQKPLFRSVRHWPGTMRI